MPKIDALTGELASIMKQVDQGQHRSALKAAKTWRTQEPTNVLTLYALGRAYEELGEIERAARAYGSVIDFFPSRADMRRMAGNWLERLESAALPLVISTYQIASEQRPDHPSVYHMLAMALVKANRYQDAIDVVFAGLKARRARRFEGVDQILREDAQLIASAIIAKEPTRAKEVKALLADHLLKVDRRKSIRFVLSWETDANDVDFHIRDRKGGHAYYIQMQLKSGGRLYADITTGYGPECFTIIKPKAFPYSLQAHYYRRGPMGYGSGKLQVIRHDGKGKLSFEDRPFVIMNDGAFVDLGKVDKRTKRGKKRKQRAK